MSSRPSSLVRHASVALGALGALAAFTLAPPAQADFAGPPRPPESPYRPESPYQPEPPYRSEEPDARYRYIESEESWPRPESGSMLRFHVGPALLVQPTGPGLFTALDIGPRAVGARVSATWLRADSDQGLAAYSGELWIDFRHRYALHPILGAGASFLHGGALGEERSAGAGVLRGALEYSLPIQDADARVSLNLSAWVPAIGTERTRPWAVAALTLGAGF